MSQNGRVRIIRVGARNFKRLEHLELAPTGDITIMAGDSGQGKSSILQVIRAAFSGASPEVITTGKDEATAFVELNDGTTIERVIRRDGPDAVMVARSGKHLKDQEAKAYLKGWSGGKAIFDPIAWVNLGGGDGDGKTARRREQRDMLLHAIPMKVTSDMVVDAIERLGEDAVEVFRLVNMPEESFSSSAPHGLVVCDELGKIAYSVRTLVNRDLDKANEDLKRTPPAEHPVPKESAEVIRATEREIQEDYLKALGAVSARQSTVTCAESLRAKIAASEAALAGVEPPSAEMIDRSIVENQSIIETLTDQLRDIRSQLNHVETQQAELRAARDEIDAKAQKIRAGKAELEHDREEYAGVKESLGGVEADPQPLARDLEEVRHFLGKREQQDAHEAAVGRAEKKRQESEALDKVVKLFRDDLPKQVLAAADLPIEGLDLGGEKGETLTINGVPLHELGTSERMRIGVEVALALNQQAGFVTVDGFESVGRADRRAFYEICAERGIDIWTSEVDPDAVPGDGRVIIQDGQVVGA